MYNSIATYTNLVFEISIDYTTGSILNMAALFPDVWQGISFDPIDNAGSTTEGVFGRFSTQTDMEFDTSLVPVDLWESRTRFKAHLLQHTPLLSLRAMPTSGH